MAVDKLVDSAQLNADLTSVANAIRTKGGTSASLAFPAGFAEAIDALETGGSGGDLVKYYDNSMTGVFTWSTPTTLSSGNLFIPAGDNLDEISLPNVTSLGASNIFSYCRAKKISLPKLTTCGSSLSVFANCRAQEVYVPLLKTITRYAFQNCTNLTFLVLPSFTSAPSSNFDNIFAGCTSLQVIDIGAAVGKAGSSGTYSGCTALNKMILRASSVRPLGTVAAFTNTPFASGKAGGTLYVPRALIQDYEAATNWSTIFSYGEGAQNQIHPIEGSIYETQYADGTPIA